MTLYRKDEERDALAYAAAGGQALHVLGVTPGRLYDRDLPRLVKTARELGQVSVHVFRTCTDRQHVVLAGMPLIRAGLGARSLHNVELVDLLNGQPAFPP